MNYPENLLKNIAETKATLKIITKTKNERLFIERWIKHHLAIIGDGKLIIFDNMSDDEHVLQVYEKYKNNIILIKFDFYHNNIHDYTIMKEFYDTIGETTDFFTVLDSDEFLYFYDDNKAIHDESILDYLRENIDCDFFAPCWLDNIEGKENLLNLNSEIHSIRAKAELVELFDWGKVIVNAKILKNPEFKKYIHINFSHTLYLPSLNYQKTQTKFFIAHLKNLDTMQRISTNMNKFVTNGLLARNDDFEGLFKLSLKGKEVKTLNSYIKQTQRLVTGQRANPLMPINLPPDKIMEIDKDDTIHFFNTFSEKAFSTLSNTNYLDLIGFDYSKACDGKYPFLRHWIGKYEFIS